MVITPMTPGVRNLRVYDVLGRSLIVYELDTETGRAVVPVPTAREDGDGVSRVFGIGKKDGKNVLLFATVYLHGCTVEGLNHIDPSLPVRMTL
jgi:hypothetical protein